MYHNIENKSLTELEKIGLIMNKTVYRTRFAPSPSGVMHIGNLRSALMSFLCAKESRGSFILRIEDTDKARTDDRFLKLIYHFLHIMELCPDEGPIQGGQFASYIQSERTVIYQEYLEKCIKKNLVYRCFKTDAELEETKKRQCELKLPPRHVRQLLKKEEENSFILSGKPFVWRFALTPMVLHIEDKVKGIMTFDLSHFADSPITRQDGTFTFLFANFVDDVTMNINYVIRGEEHMSNSAVQAYMYHALDIPLPLFYHLPLICDQSGKKLSKRDFGFNIQDLLDAGFLPQAILNYLSIIGGSFKEEIFDLDFAIKENIFFQTKATGLITYDFNKLLWVNKKWMQRIDIHSFILYIKEQYAKEVDLSAESIALMEDIKNESHTCKEFFDFLYAIKQVSSIELDSSVKSFVLFLKKIAEEEKEEYLSWVNLKMKIKEYSIHFAVPEKELYKIVRFILVHCYDGISLSVLLKHISKRVFLDKINILVFT